MWLGPHTDAKSAVEPAPKRAQELKRIFLHALTVYSWTLCNLQKHMFARTAHSQTSHAIPEGRCRLSCKSATPQLSMFLPCRRSGLFLQAISVQTTCFFVLCLETGAKLRTHAHAEKGCLHPRRFTRRRFQLPRFAPTFGCLALICAISSCTETPTTPI